MVLIREVNMNWIIVRIQWLSKCYVTSTSTWGFMGPQLIAH